jgi:hypothetical protein
MFRHYVWKNIITYLTPKFTQKIIQCRKIFVTILFSPRPPKLILCKKDSVFTRAEEIVIALPSSNKLS